MLCHAFKKHKLCSSSSTDRIMIVKLRSDNSGKRKVPLFFSLGTRHCFRRFFCHLSAPRRRSWMVLARENLILKWMMVWGSPYLWKPPITAKKQKNNSYYEWTSQSYELEIFAKNPSSILPDVTILSFPVVRLPLP